MWPIDRRSESYAILSWRRVTLLTTKAYNKECQGATSRLAMEEVLPYLGISGPIPMLETTEALKKCKGTRKTDMCILGLLYWPGRADLSWCRTLVPIPGAKWTVKSSKDRECGYTKTRIFKMYWGRVWWGLHTTCTLRLAGLARFHPTADTGIEYSSFFNYHLILKN